MTGEEDTPYCLKDEKELSEKQLKKNLSLVAQVESPASFPGSSSDNILNSLSSLSLNSTLDSSGKVETLMSYFIQ